MFRGDVHVNELTWGFLKASIMLEEVSCKNKMSRNKTAYP
jgi:hypothetical protein